MIVYLPGSVGKVSDSLSNDVETLLHFQHSHQVPVIHITIGADWNLKVKAVVSGVGKELAHVIDDPAAAQGSSGATVANRIRHRQGRDPLGPVEPEAVVGQQIVILAQSGWKQSEKIHN